MNALGMQSVPSLSNFGVRRQYIFRGIGAGRNVTSVNMGKAGISYAIVTNYVTVEN
jgi:hypothetical protein